MARVGSDNMATWGARLFTRFLAGNRRPLEVSGDHLKYMVVRRGPLAEPTRDPTSASNYVVPPEWALLCSCPKAMRTAL